MRRWTHAALALALLLSEAAAGQTLDAGPPDGGAAAAEGFRVTFVINDSMVKNKLLPAVGIGVARAETADKTQLLSGKTGPRGSFQASLPPGNYLVTYRKLGYVPIERSPLTVTKDGQVVTTTLSMMLEAAGQSGQRRVQFVLNWGNDHDRHVADLDAHLAFTWDQDPREIYFGHMKERGEATQQAELDVDDMNYGGPETITLLDPPPGDYHYWVYDYSGGSEHLGDSEVIVRVLVGDQLSEEFRIPVTVENRHWRPFRALHIDDLGDARIVPWTKEELATGADRHAPALSQGVGESLSCESCEDTLPFIIGPLILLFALIQVLRSRAAARRKN